MLSVMALYNYDSSIFDDLAVPFDDEMRPLFDKQTLIDDILFRNAELSLLYSDPETFKRMVKVWSISSQYTWKTLAETMYLEYNPIWNKDGTITETTQGSGTSESKVAAYNASTYQPRDYSEGNTSGTLIRVEQGNIGVTSSQALLMEQRSVAMFNVYDEIADDFKNRFCILVY